MGSICAGGTLRVQAMRCNDARGARGPTIGVIFIAADVL
jgi:hypothetical protein